MAKDILYIADGATVDPAWTGHIVISGDGVNWDGINKTGLSVGKHAINVNTSVSNSYPERGEKSGFVVTIKGSDEKSPKLSFNPDKVLNQAAWSTIAPGTASNLSAGAIQAVTDILTWLA
jgi:hypothetical protein